MNLWGNQIFPIFQSGPKLITRQLITRTCAYQGVRNVRFSESLACFVFFKLPFSDSSFCLITDEMRVKLISTYALCYYHYFRNEKKFLDVCVGWGDYALMRGIVWQNLIFLDFVCAGDFNISSPSLLTSPTLITHQPKRKPRREN